MTPEQQRQKIVRRERLIKLAIVIAILSIGATILLAVPNMLVSFLLAFVVTYLFKPIVNYFETMGVGRSSSILIPFLLTGVIIAGVATYAVPRAMQQASTLQTELPKYVKGINDLTKRHTKTLNAFVGQFSKIDLTDKATTWMQDSLGSALNNVPNLVSQLLAVLLLAPIFAFFMLRDGRTISRRILALVPNNLFEVAMNLFYQINKQLGGFIRARLLEALLVGGVVWVGLYLIGFPYAFLLSVFAGVTNLIPYVGPIIGAVPGLIVALVNQDSSSAVWLVGLIYIIAQVLDMVIVIPFVVAKIVDLHPVTVIVVIIVGSQVMGVLGMIISVPVASIIKLTFTEFYNHVVDFQR